MSEVDIFDRSLRRRDLVDTFTVDAKGKAKPDLPPKPKRRRRRKRAQG